SPCRFWSDAPAGVFLRVVALFAEPGRVVHVGWSVLVPGADGVDMPDWRVAIGGATAVVAGFDEPSHARGEETCPRVSGKELARAWCREESSQPNVEVLICLALTAGQELPGPL